MFTRYLAMARGIPTCQATFPVPAQWTTLDQLFAAMPPTFTPNSTTSGGTDTLTPSVTPLPDDSFCYKCLPLAAPTHPACWAGRLDSTHCHPAHGRLPDHSFKRATMLSPVTHHTTRVPVNLPNCPACADHACWVASFIISWLCHIPPI